MSVLDAFGAMTDLSIDFEPNIPDALAFDESTCGHEPYDEHLALLYRYVHLLANGRLAEEVSRRQYTVAYVDVSIQTMKENTLQYLRSPYLTRKPWSLCGQIEASRISGNR